MPRGRRNTNAAAEAPIQTIGQAAQTATATVDTEPDPNGEAAAFQLPACITERQLKALLRADDGYTEQINSLNGERGAEISNATERQHLHKKAYSVLKQLRKMPTAEKKALFFYTFLEYVKLSGELRIIEAVPTLPLDGEGESNAPSGTVVPLRAAAE